MSDSLEFRKLAADDLMEFHDLLRYAFQVTRDDLIQVGWEDEEILKSKSPILDKADVFGWFDQDKLVSQIAVYPMQMNIHNVIYDMGFVTGVATYPEYSSKGLVKKLMQEALWDMKEKGQSISLLYPYSIPYYRHRGWEVISNKMNFHIKDTQLPTGLEAGGEVRRFPSECEEILHLHDLFARSHHGCIVRNKLVWEEYWRWDPEDIQVAVYYDAAGHPQGYMVYLLQEDVMRIKEMVCMNYEAWKGLWIFITAHDSMVDEIFGNNFYNRPIAFWLPDSAIKETIRPYMMGRIVDLEKFFSQYQALPQPTEFAVDFIVEDCLLDWNTGRFSYRFTPEGKILPADSPSPHTVTLSIGTLTSMMMGYITPEELATMERMVASPQSIAQLSLRLKNQKPYISENM